MKRKYLHDLFIWNVVSYTFCHFECCVILCVLEKNVLKTVHIVILGHFQLQNSKKFQTMFKPL